MPPFQAPGTNNPTELLVPGVPGYAFGSKAVGPTAELQITNVALTGNVATISVSVQRGNIPTTSGLITIRGTQAAGGAFNVTNVAITGVTINSQTGIGTITFALVHADVVSVADAGQAHVPVPQIGEALVNGASKVFAIPSVGGQNDNGVTVTWSTAYPSAPGAVTMTLQAAEENVDSAFQQLDTSTSVTGEIRSITLTRFRFIRVLVSGASGGSSPTAIVTVNV